VAPCANWASLRATAASFVPIVDWLPRYRWHDDLVADLIAGLTIGVMHVPQGGKKELNFRTFI
jgi:hypothetical protein